MLLTGVRVRRGTVRLAFLASLKNFLKILVLKKRAFVGHRVFGEHQLIVLQIRELMRPLDLEIHLCRQFYSKSATSIPLTQLSRILKPCPFQPRFLLIQNKRRLGRIAAVFAVSRGRVAPATVFGPPAFQGWVDLLGVD